MNLLNFRRYAAFFVFLFFVSSRLSAQYDFSYGTADDLVRNVLAGEGVQISNVVFRGHPQQIGRFSNAQNTNLGLKAGIIMSVGDAAKAKGPNNDEGQTTSFDENVAYDVDLDSLLKSLNAPNRRTKNIVAIEFDFIPTGDSLSFNYVFGSEEYNEWVCGQFFDVFGFFLSGPGINGNYSNNAQNLALIPGTNLPITINTLNSGVPGEDLSPSGCPEGGLSNSQYYINNTGGGSLQMNGFSKVLTAQAKVRCGELYHIKLILANGMDHVMDSFVFLEAESFKANPAEINAGIGLLPDTSFVEGCRALDLFIVREKATGVLDLPLNYTGDAVPGVDYEMPPSTIHFGDGQDTVKISIVPIVDNEEEGKETFTISFTIKNDCGDDVLVSRTFFIKDPYALDLTVSPASRSYDCPGNVSMEAAVSGGNGPYSYLWETGATTRFANIQLNETDTIYVRVRDQLDCELVQAYDTVIYELNYQTLETFTLDTVICTGDVVTIGAGILFGKEPFTITWLPGGQDTEYITVNPATRTKYEFFVRDACNITRNDSVIVDVPEYKPLTVNLEDTTICKGGSVLLSPKTTGGLGTLIYEWSGDAELTEVDDSTSSSSPVASTRFKLTVTDACGAIVRDSMLAKVISCQISVPNSFSPNGDGINDYLIIPNIEDYPDSEFSLYNRWGNLVYHAKGYDNTWGGSNIIPGTYFYVLDLKNDTDVIKGFIAVFAD